MPAVARRKRSTKPLAAPSPPSDYPAYAFTRANGDREFSVPMKLHVDEPTIEFLRAEAERRNASGSCPDGGWTWHELAATLAICGFEERICELRQREELRRSLSGSTDAASGS